MPSKLVAAVSVSVDGVLQAPMLRDEDPSGGFAHGGWMAAYSDEELDAEMAGVFEHAGAMLMGHRTYDILAGFWPAQPAEQGAEQLNRMKKYVATRRAFEAAWENTELLVGEAATEVAALKQRTEGTIVLQGSSDLLRALQNASLVDEYRLFVFPLVLGRGKRVFSDGAASEGLRLVRSKTTTSGIVCSTYAHDGQPRRAPT